MEFKNKIKKKIQFIKKVTLTSYDQAKKKSKLISFLDKFKYLILIILLYKFKNKKCFIFNIYYR
jgi:hypothetical protein